MGRTVGPRGRVIAFEPIDEKRVLLERNLDSANLSGVAEVIAGCVGSESGSVTFTYVPNDPGKSAMHLREDLLNSAAKMKTASKRVVPISRIDDIADIANLRFLKIDVEGAELAVMQGARETIKRDRPIVHFEMGLPSLKVFGIQPDQIRVFLADLDYLIFDVLGNDVSEPRIFALSAETDGVYDYIAVPVEEADTDLVAECALAIFSDPNKAAPPLV